MAGAGRMGYVSVRAGENGSSLCDDAFCVLWEASGGWAGGRASERRPGDRATGQAGMQACRRYPGGDERALG